MSLLETLVALGLNPMLVGPVSSAWVLLVAFVMMGGSADSGAFAVMLGYAIGAMVGLVCTIAAIIMHKSMWWSVRRTAVATFATTLILLLLFLRNLK